MIARSDSAASRLDSAAALLNQGRGEEAAGVCNDVLAAEPRNARALFLAGVCALQAGDNEAAVVHLEAARAVAGPAPEIVNNLGSAYLLCGRLDDAEAALLAAIGARPEFAKAHVNIASVYRLQGRLAEAETHLLQARDIAGNTPEIIADAALVLFLMRRWRDAAEAYEALCAYDPDDREAAMKLVTALAQAGDPGRAVEAARDVGDEGEARAERLARCADAVLGAGWETEAYDLFQDALALDPHNALATKKCGDLLQRMVPRWHFSMLHDTARNEAYDRVITGLVEPGSIVLDIGSGSGLLAMMAARAGAAHVYSCEGVPVIARKAREIVAANGLSDRITIIEKWSTDLEVGTDLPRRADVLISEILGHALIGEGCLPSLDHAIANLIREDARISPRSGTIFVALLECPDLYERTHVSEAGGFDVSLFNAFSHSGKSTSISLLQDAPALLSAPVTAFSFDFTKGGFHEDAMTASVECLREGTLHGAFAWFELDVGDGLAIDTHPDRSDNHWAHETYLLREPRPVRAGETVTIEARHDMMRLQLHVPG